MAQTTPQAGERTALPVLVVDDEPEIRTFVRLALEDEGYAVRAASNGAEALEALREMRPCVILLDLRMPGMDGVTFVETYRNRAATAAEPHADGAHAAPIIVLTASRMPADDVEALGVQGVLRKPFEVAELLETIARHAACVSHNGKEESGGAGTTN